MNYERVDVELRGAKLDGNKLSGVAHTFGKRTLRDGQYEEFAPTAFNKILKDPTTDARAFVNHNPDLLLGRQSAGTLRVDAQEDGVHFSIDLPNTSYANDLKESVRRGDMDGASFGFMPGKWVMSFAQDGIPVRTHTEVEQFIDLGPVALPAFAGTGLQLRSLKLAKSESTRSQLVRIRHKMRGIGRSK
jgi:Escherichia/Staphylococcus phage prohead protease